MSLRSYQDILLIVDFLYEMQGHIEHCHRFIYQGLYYLQTVWNKNFQFDGSCKLISNAESQDDILLEIHQSVFELLAKHTQLIGKSGLTNTALELTKTSLNI